MFGGNPRVLHALMWLPPAHSGWRILRRGFSTSIAAEARRR